MPILTFLSLAFATEVTIDAADGQKAVVLIDDLVKGETPVVTDVDGGEVTLGFRSSMFGPVLFTQKVQIPADGKVAFTVDVAERKVSGSGVVEPEPAAAPAPAPSATRLSLTSVPAGASIELDGKDTGKKTPSTFDVDPGRHVVKLLKGCQSAERELSVDDGATEDLQLELDAAKVMLSVTVIPEGATVEIDGKKIGEAPLEAKLSCGERLVSVSKEGFKSAEKKVELGLEDSAVDFELPVDAYGTLEITVEPEGVILLDGERVGANEASLAKVGVGKHTLTIERGGVEVESRSIEVKENATVMLTLVVPEPDAVAVKDKKDKKGKKDEDEKDAKAADTDEKDPPKEEKQPKPAKVKAPRTGPSAVRIITNSAVTAASVPFIALGTYNFSQALRAVRQAESEPDQSESDRIVKEEVRPREVLAYAEWGVGGALLLTGATLWITSFTDGSDVVVLPTPNGLQINGRF